MGAKSAVFAGVDWGEAPAAIAVLAKAMADGGIVVLELQGLRLERAPWAAAPGGSAEAPPASQEVAELLAQAAAAAGSATDEEILLNPMAGLSGLKFHGSLNHG